MSIKISGLHLENSYSINIDISDGRNSEKLKITHSNEGNQVMLTDKRVSAYRLVGDSLGNIIFPCTVEKIDGCLADNHFILDENGICVYHGRSLAAPWFNNIYTGHYDEYDTYEIGEDSLHVKAIYDSSTLLFRGLTAKVYHRDQLVFEV